MPLCDACQQEIDASGISEKLQRGKLEVWPRRQVAMWDGVPVRLAPASAAILAALIRMGEATGARLSAAVGFGNIGNQILFLRRSLADAGAPDIIKHRRGWGYVLDVSAGDADAHSDAHV